ncbi:protease inhibitor I42 family protein [Kitasatospora sp. NPDC004669]|uniref:protease inhibitor I42 family protein n=1 Tax=Kitasatospora sp. NPDC004669 TaxID=3154555 RepID=UPI0033BAC33F
MKKKWQRILLVAVVLLAVAGAAGAVAIHKMTTGKLDHGTVFTATSGELAVKPGQLFSVEVSAHREWGDIWTVADPAPDPAVVQTVGDEFVRNVGLANLGGAIGSDSGGHYYFVFRAARNPGRTTVTVHVAYRDELGGTFSGGPEQTKRQFTVNVG